MIIGVIIIYFPQYKVLLGNYQTKQCIIFSWFFTVVTFLQNSVHIKIILKNLLSLYVGGDFLSNNFSEFFICKIDCEYLKVIRAQ